MLRFVVCMLLTLVSSVLVAVPGFAHGPNDPPHQLYKAGDLRLESGEVIQDFAISYVTHGMLNAKKSNAILMVTAIGGNHHRIDFLIGPGRALDFTKYFIIATDAIGNGLTTSPAPAPPSRGCSFLASPSATWSSRSGACWSTSGSRASWR